MAPADRGSRLFDKDELRDLSRRRPLRAAFAIARQWAVLIAAGTGAVWWGHWYGYVLAIVVIATRQHALAVLMHDGAHRSLFTSRRVNDVVSDLLLAFPLFISTSLYRRHHLDHHRYLNTDRDPDLDTEALKHTSKDWARLFAGDVTGTNLLKTVDSLDQFSLLPVLRGDRSVARAMGRGPLVLFLCYLAALAATVVLTGGWLVYLLLWVVPSLTALSMILRLRAAAEHVGCDLDGGVGGTRTVLAARWNASSSRPAGSTTTWPTTCIRASPSTTWGCCTAGSWSTGKSATTPVSPAPISSARPACSAISHRPAATAPPPEPGPHPP